jgi:TRAP-type C4-dicarboxylate transport system permease small subunit
MSQTPDLAVETTPAPAVESAGRSLLDSLFHACAVASALCIAAICVLMMVQSLSREMGFTVKGIDDIVGWLCAASASLILAHTFQRGGIVRVEMLFDQLPVHRRRAFELLALSVSTLFGLYLLYAFGSFVYQTWDIGEVSQGQIIVPLWIPQVFTLAGCAVFCLALVDELVRVVRGDKPRYQVAQEEKMARGDFGEGI